MSPASGSVPQSADDRVGPGVLGDVPLDRAMSVGASLRLVTVMVKTFSVDRPAASVLRTRIE